MNPNDPQAKGSTTEGLAVAPSLAPSLIETRVPQERALVDKRVVFICALSILVALGAGVVARVLTGLIAFVTNISFFGRFSAAPASPADNHLGPWVIAIPVLGAVVV
ncbi:MAG: hypothetical protein LC689_23370, partial [Myxococcales bacterium]|nr:hypothetical protein [Myxococcales bacterium]